MIVFWQGVTVSILSLPLALVFWTWPTPGQWLIFVIAGVLGSTGHFCLTHSLKAADISATQSVKFLDLIWATMWGFLGFGDTPAGAKPDFSQPGDVGVISDIGWATDLPRKIVGYREADKRGINVGRRAGDAALDGGRKTDADGTGPAVSLDQRPDRGADRLGRRRARRLDADALARQLPGRGVDHRALDPRPADVDAQNFHAVPFLSVSLCSAPPQAPERASGNRTAPENAETASRPAGRFASPTLFAA